MKTLILIRHAKSDWSQQLSDHDRPLNTRGTSDAPDMGQRLRQRLEADEVVIDQILSSSACRAKTTAELIAKQLQPVDEPIRIEPKLYASSPSNWLHIIQSLPNGDDCVLMIGHNPEISTVVSKLAGSYQEMATGTVAQFSFDIKNWKDIIEATPQQIIMDYPKRPYQP